MSKLVLVTGGMGGIGTKICHSLFLAGYKVVTTYYTDNKRTQDWMQQMSDLHYDFNAYQCNVANFESCAQLVDKIRHDLGSVDILINNAGITRDSVLGKMTKENWDIVLRTNLYSMFNMTKQVLDDMIEKKWGRIVNISSINGQKGQFGQANYSAAKAGVHGFTMAIAQETARKGITVNTVAPGYIATDMVMSIAENVREKIIQQIPVGRLGTPDDIASLIEYLVSDEASFMTGSEIAINGGQHMM